MSFGKYYGEALSKRVPKQAGIRGGVGYWTGTGSFRYGIRPEHQTPHPEDKPGTPKPKANRLQGMALKDIDTHIETRKLDPKGFSRDEKKHMTQLQRDENKEMRQKYSKNKDTKLTAEGIMRAYKILTKFLRR